MKSGKVLSICDFFQQNYLCLSFFKDRQATYTFYQQLFLKHNLAFHVEMEAGTMDQVLAMVQSDLGVGFYPESMAAPALAAGTVFQIHLAEPIPERFVNLIEDTSRPQSVAMKAFKKMLLAPEEEQNTGEEIISSPVFFGDGFVSAGMGFRAVSHPAPASDRR